MAVVLKAAPALQGIVLACWAAYTDDGLILCCVLTWRSSACRTLASCLTTFNPSVLNPPTDEDFADLPADVDLEEQRMLMAAIQGGGYEGHIPGGRLNQCCTAPVPSWLQLANGCAIPRAPSLLAVAQMRCTRTLCHCSPFYARPALLPRPLQTLPPTRGTSRACCRRALRRGRICGRSR